MSVRQCSGIAAKTPGSPPVPPGLVLGKTGGSVNVEQALNDPDSLFYHYQKLIALRKEHSAISRGSFHPVAPEHDKVFACIREDGSESILVVNNFYGENTELRPGDTIDGYRPLISNYNLRPVEEDMVLRPYKSAVWIRMKN